MDRIGCFFMTARTFSDLEARVLKAEELGYDVCGFPHIAGRDAMATLAAIDPRPPASVWPPGSCRSTPARR